MIAIIVASPLQVFNSIIIMNHFYPNEKADLFIWNSLCDMRQVADLYKGVELIDSIYDMAQIFKGKTRIGSLWDHLVLSKEQKRLLDKVKSKNYTDMFTTWVGGIATWLFTKLSKYNHKLKLHYYEEGIGVYLNRIYTDYNRIKIMYKLLKYKCEVDYLEDIYLYKTKLPLHLPEKLKKVEIGVVTEKDIQVLRRGTISSEKIFIPYQAHCIYFENNFRNTMFEGFNSLLVLEQIANILGKENLCVRLHPKTTNDVYSINGYMKDKNSMAWEDIISLKGAIENQILITTISTSVYSPKLIYEKEPRILILGKLISNEYSNYKWAANFWERNFAEFTLRFKDTYNKKENFQIPESFKELESILKMWK
ncbi:MAG: hypothetical protein HFG39_06215 [Lachnospiraceae bacterium]|nr:hypothetical protein [Lachnospiraceae bacterium]